MVPKLYLETLKNFESLFESKENYDVVIQAGEEQKEIYAHSLVLCCQSNYFYTAFSSNWAEKKNGKYFLKKPNISSHILEIILRYLYCGEIDLSVDNEFDILKLSIAVDEFGLETLNEYIHEFLINNQSKFLQTYDPIEILEFAFQHETVMVQNYCLETICHEPGILFGTDEIFLKLSAELLEFIFKQEVLALDEIEVWNNLIKWGHAQHPTIHKKVSKWSNEDFALMKKTISRFIQFIRFQDITSKEFSSKILPYKALFKGDLNSYLYPNTLLPSRIIKADSVIINVRHMALFSTWIDKKDKTYNLKQVPYQFNLILRGSMDGFDAKSFHKKCNNKGATIVIAKVKGTDQIVGGYNPLEWDSSGKTKSTKASFIFSFTNKTDISTATIGRVVNEQNAIHCYNYNGPAFGPSNDLFYLFYNEYYMKWYCSQYNYSSINLPFNSFVADDYEVFQVIQKK